MKKKVITVFGTRPEAIKMCPVVAALSAQEDLQTFVCVTGQHRMMLDQVLACFDIKPDFDLNIMKNQQTLESITSEILSQMTDIYTQVEPDLILVHGDTTTTFAVALSAFYNNIPIGHVEAGLRTYNLREPFPEEFNRHAVSLMATLHFAPTDTSKTNLLQEGIQEESIFVTGNTVIDALKTTIQDHYSHPVLEWASGCRLILITAHRRENLGQPLLEMLSAVRQIADENPDVKIIYPVHLNPAVQSAANDILNNHPRIRLIAPLDVMDFHNFMARAFLLLTDSGGIQEEAPALNKPVLVMRNVTERPEGIAAGTLKLVGNSQQSVYDGINQILQSEKDYQQMATAQNPYGDGFASFKIAEKVKAFLKG